jgi:hypothetical protein
VHLLAFLVGMGHARSSGAPAWRACTTSQAHLGQPLNSLTTTTRARALAAEGGAVGPSVVCGAWVHLCS